MKDRQVTQSILDAATEVFIQKGKDGARMQEIADRAGVNKMLLHYYFKDKDTLFYEVLKKIVADLYGSVIDETASLPTFQAFLHTFIDRHFAFLNERKDMLQFLLWELSRRQVDVKAILSESCEGYRQTPCDILAARLKQAMANGEIRTVDPADFIANLFSLNLFIFIALPGIRALTAADDAEVARLIERRKKEIYRLLWNDIRLS